MRRSSAMAMMLLAAAAVLPGAPDARAQQKEENLLTNGGFETLGKIKVDVLTGRTYGPGWWVAHSAERGEVATIAADGAVEGRQCLRIRKSQPGSYFSLRIYPEMPIADFRGPYRVSCRLRTAGREVEGKAPITFAIGERAAGGTRTSFRIASIPVKSEWTEYSAVITKKDVAFRRENDKWMVLFTIAGFQGTVWIDDVKLVELETPAVTVGMDAGQYFAGKSPAAIKGTLDPEKIEIGKALATVSLLDARGAVIRKTEHKLDSAQFRIPLDISELKEGGYKVRLQVVDNSKKTITLECSFDVVADPFDF